MEISLLGLVVGKTETQLHHGRHPVEQRQSGPDVDTLMLLPGGRHDGVEEIHTQLQIGQQRIDRSGAGFPDGVKLGQKQHRLLEGIAMLVVIMQHRLLRFLLIALHGSDLLLRHKAGAGRRQCRHNQQNPEYQLTPHLQSTLGTVRK